MGPLSKLGKVWVDGDQQSDPQTRKREDRGSSVPITDQMWSQAAGEVPIVTVLPLN